ncbi:MAG: type II secretion system protein [Sedimentisphaeraceae bacterium JB056]
MSINRKTGFTLVELLTVVGIIAILIALLLPALNKVKTLSFDTKQRGQINAIEIAIETYRNDFGMYPASGNVDAADDTPKDSMGVPYYGTEKLAEALMGHDLLGVHKDVPTNFYKFGIIYDQTATNLSNRKGPYLETEKLNPVESGSTEDIFNLVDGGHYISDVYRRDDLSVGLPLLYYKADTNNKIQTGTAVASIADKIYDFRDSNMPYAGTVSGDAEANYIQGRSNIWDTTDGTTAEDNFDDSVINYDISPTAGVYTIPYRAQTYLLISAGNDGIYGTEDDICNFEKN